MKKNFITDEDGIEYANTDEDGWLDKGLELIRAMMAEEEKKKAKADHVRAMRMAGLPVKRT